MDQILHRKLIIEKTNLEFQVAKANKEVAKLMETVQQYEAVLASLDEETFKSEKTPSVPGKNPASDAGGIVPRLPRTPSRFENTGHKLEIPKNPVLRGSNQGRQTDKPVNEAILRGSAAMKRKSQLSGEKLPTAAEAKKHMGKIKVNRELEQAGLGRLDPSRLDEVLDTVMDKKVAANVAKHSLKQVQDEKKMLGNMPEVTPARMTLLAQQAKNRESLINRLGKN
jgi:hypothetical protein